MFIKADDLRLAWKGTVSLEKNNGSVTPWRIPYKDKDIFPDEELHFEASKTSGIRLMLKTDSKTIKLSGKLIGKSDTAAPPGCQVDLCIDNKIIQTQIFDKNNEILFTDLPAGNNVIEFWFSPSRPIILHGVEIDDNASLEYGDDKRLKWITYGSSITLCVRAVSPAMTWPAIVARNMDLDLTSLSYGGQCKLDPMIARMIRDMDADFISLKLGINIYASDLSPRTFLAAVIGTIATIREKHENTPLVVCSPIYCPPRENTPSKLGNTMENMRVSVKQAVESFQKRGDKNIYYIDGLKIFGSELAAHLPDKMHPDAEGMEFMAKNFMNEVFNKHQLKLVAEK